MEMLILLIVSLFCMLGISILGKRLREQYEAKQSQLTDEEKGIVWVKGKDGMLLPINEEDGSIRLEELLK